MKSLSGRLEEAGLKPLKLEKTDPNEIIEVYDNYRMIPGLIPERITRREDQKRFSKKIKQDEKQLRKFLEDKKYLEQHVFPKIKMEFGYCS